MAARELLLTPTQLVLESRKAGARGEWGEAGWERGWQVTDLRAVTSPTVNA